MREEAFHESLRRCIERSQFFDCFYEAFMASSPEIEGMFADTDMERQKRMLKFSLYTIATFVGEMETMQAMAHLSALGQRHREQGVRPEEYDLWLDALIEAVQRCDTEFDAEVEASWRRVMRRAIDVMLSDETGPNGDRSTVYPGG